MVNCASCVGKVCSRGIPCPVGEHLKKFAFKEYRKAGNLKLFQKSSLLEVEGYMKYPRVKELIRLAEEMNWNKLGLAFCIGLSEEAKKLQEVLESHGVEVHSVVCKVGGVKKEKFNLPKEKDHACNPILQAMVLNEVGTDLNIIVGLCMGHDVMFQVYSKAPTTTLIVKDRVLAHNPAGALYSRYHFKKLMKHPKKER